MQPVSPIQLANIKRIQNASHSGRLVLFVGAGVSKNSGVPMWGELIEKMKSKLEYQLTEAAKAWIIKRNAQ